MTAHKIDHRVVDGADETQKELRNELFSISNIRGKYPQVFLSNKSDTTTFVGDFYAVELLEENKDTPGVPNVHTRRQQGLGDETGAQSPIAVEIAKLRQRTSTLNEENAQLQREIAELAHKSPKSQATPE
ncbi:hypothetical protein BASA81_005560 [Batrachochytrium salamandrivorans]|nr:hypothetical protein BASA81_005560 [Batrachochytrium salamandrivorans]